VLRAICSKCYSQARLSRRRCVRIYACFGTWKSFCILSLSCFT